MQHRRLKLTTAIIAVLSLPSFAQENVILDTIDVISEAEKYKAADGLLRTTANLGLLGEQTAFTSPITVVNYEARAFVDKSPRNIVDGISKTDASTMNFGGETNTLSGVYVRGLQLDSRQISLNGLSGLYSTYSSPVTGVESAQLIKGASTAIAGMDPEGSAGASMNIQTKCHRHPH